MYRAHRLIPFFSRSDMYRRHHDWRCKAPDTGKLVAICSLFSWFTAAAVLYVVRIYTEDVAFPIRHERSASLNSATADTRYFNISGTIVVNSTSSGDEFCVSAIDNFPPGAFDEQQLKSGAVVIPLLVAAYMVLALTIACDEYFVPSMQCVCESLSLEPDVAGATFMAVSSSAPEFFTAIVGIVMEESDISLGTILGSIAFNVLFILGILGLVFGSSPKLSWWPMIRDLVCYVISVIALTVVIMDGRVYWYEALIMIAMYVGYVLLMHFNASMRQTAETFVESCWTGKKAETDDELRTLNVKANGIVKTESVFSSSTCNNGAITIELDSASHTEKELKDENKDNSCTPRPPDGIMARVGWTFTIPIRVAFCLTIPDCTKPRWRKFYMLTIVMTACWLGALSYILIWMATIAGTIFGMPDSVMALIFLGAGSSVPDLVASFLVAKKGGWDMAVANCLGSNIFEVLLCLSIPWIFAAVTVSEHCVQFISEGMSFISVMLILVIVVTWFIIACNGWKLDRKLGVLNMFLYVAFTAGTLLFSVYVAPSILPSCG
ncbi:sodium/potassium/calcium exchanger 5-like isoform X1 [Ptychodera flava]|uniref:sodium/potassium/calcium exchanger 5-like isoform X1 n=1 Tax=Ptychodera flava TaxID=63121 RepID=UPI003969CDF0